MGRKAWDTVVKRNRDQKEPGDRPERMPYLLRRTILVHLLLPIVRRLVSAALSEKIVNMLVPNEKLRRRASPGRQDASQHINRTTPLSGNWMILRIMKKIKSRPRKPIQELILSHNQKIKGPVDPTGVNQNLKRVNPLALKS